MEGVAKSTLILVRQALLDDMGTAPHDDVVLKCLDGLLKHCREIDEWYKIEDAPSDTPIIFRGPNNYREPYTVFIINGYKSGTDFYDVTHTLLSEKGWEPTSWRYP